MEAALIIGITLGAMGLICIPMFIFVYHASKNNAKEKRERLELKHTQQLENKQLDFQIEKERLAMTPRFCRYCGAKHDANAKNCSVCGAVL